MRGPIILILLLILVIGGMFALSRSVDEQPKRMIEVDVATNAPAR